jgi:hypothetical protein
MFDSSKLKLKSMIGTNFYEKQVCASCELLKFFFFCMVFTHVHSCFNLVVWTLFVFSIIKV